VGFTFKNLETPENFRAFFGDLIVAFGVSYKGITFLPFKNFHAMDGLRISVGGVLYKEVNDQSTPGKERIKLDFIIGGTGDLNLKKLLGPLATIGGF